MRRRLIGAVMTMLAACSGAATGPTTHGTGPVVTRADAGAAVTGSGAPPPLTVRECDALIEHAVAVQAAGGSATKAEIDATVAALKSDVGEPCAALPRAAYACAMAAQSGSAIAACEP